jgi:DNA-binding MarR family transcriptional regulator
MLGEASYTRTVPKDLPLNADEERFWRALVRILIVLPRVLERDLTRSAGLSANEYATLVSLSEAPGRELRMADLAACTGLTPSRISRLVDDLQSRDLVTKRPSPEDGRGNVATLSAQGLAKLKAAWPAHLASARRRTLDHIEPADLRRAAEALSRVAAALDD